MLISFPQLHDWLKASRKSINDVSILELLQNLYDYQVGWWCFITWPWFYVYLSFPCNFYAENIPLIIDPPFGKLQSPWGTYDNTVNAFSLFDNQRKSVKTRNSVQGHGDFKSITKMYVGIFNSIMCQLRKIKMFHNVQEINFLKMSLRRFVLWALDKFVLQNICSSWWVPFSLPPDPPMEIIDPPYLN